ncbi:PREDICTED: probable leucine-rich repeat receptor-like protein kinase At1g35710 [Ipomoea nil]|uniref:probable leucine-rich repeat receptor-like protein kinase At1g35710 n=1 Tax=Ipomoea nil TaxID=35883 RepID=UPI0009018CF0|nr:PREDICTED: probable leucine-rich repeat receptor-like protein kinase At1g35710 [Ipomoea nil]
MYQSNLILPKNSTMRNFRYNYTALIIFLVLPCFFAWETTASARTEAEALLKWKSSLLMLSSSSSSSLNSWSLSNLRSMCNWTGIVCNGGGATVSEINLPHAHLSGTLYHLNFTSLSSLTGFNISGNNFNGSIPPAIGDLSNLIFLDLSNNTFDGSIPPQIGKLRELQYLSLYYNNFSGVVPHQIGNLRKGICLHGFSSILKRWQVLINIYHKTYTKTPIIATLSTGVVPLVRVFAIDLSSNKFEGHIPNSIGDLLALRELNLSHNMLVGHIPISLGNLSMLESLDLPSNKISGAIPGQLASITTLEVLNLSHNKLMGCIPEGRQFNTFEANSYQGNDGLKGKPLSRGCENGLAPQLPTPKDLHQEDDSSFFTGCTVKVVAMGYGCGILFGLFMGSLMLLTGKPEFIVRFVEEETYRLTMKIKRRRSKTRRRN